MNLKHLSFQQRNYDTTEAPNTVTSFPQRNEPGPGFTVSRQDPGRRSEHR